MAIIERLRVDIMPKQLSPWGATELQIEVRMLGGKVFHSKTMFPDDDFTSAFDRMMERATREIKHHLEQERISDAAPVPTK